MAKVNYGYYSRVLNKVFDTVKELEEAETAYEEQIKKEEEAKLAEIKKKEALEAEKNSKWQDVIQAFNALDELKTKNREEEKNATTFAIKVLKEFTEKYGEIDTNKAAIKAGITIPSFWKYWFTF